MIYQTYASKLMSACRNRRWKVTKKKLNSEYEFLTVKVNEGASRSVCFSAGIHGDEQAGPEAVLRFVEEAEVPDDVFVLLMPVVNPWGFNKGVRANAFRQDINRRFCDKLLAGEAKTAYSTLKKNPVNLFCSLHEWYGKDGFYMYASDKIKRQEIEGIPPIAEKWFKVFDKQKINDESVEKGIIWHPDEGYEDAKSKCTLENRMFDEKVHYVCLETPSQADLDKRTLCQFRIMEYLLKRVV